MGFIFIFLSITINYEGLRVSRSVIDDSLVFHSGRWWFINHLTVTRTSLVSTCYYNL